MNWIAAALIGGSLLLPPFLAGDFYINLASQILIAAIFALSLNLLVGFGGMTSLGHASYLGVAAYISALRWSRRRSCCRRSWPAISISTSRARF